MKLSHAVITSVDRDDLEDMGASYLVKTLRKIKELNPAVTLEALIPDFQGNLELVKQVASCGAYCFHNMETVKRLTPVVGVWPDTKQAWRLFGLLPKLE